MSERFQILSLDGGGIKGIFSAAVLAAIEEDLSVKITEHFDLIVGTSTGGIIALGLGLGLSPKDIVTFYIANGPNIFANLCWSRNLLHWFRRKFPQDKLMDALRAPGVFGDKILGDSVKPLVIPSYNLGADDVYLFKTPHHERLRCDWKVPAWKIALATCAAPTYFTASRHIEQIRHIDGGVWANNPIIVGIAEAVSMFPVELKHIHVLSLGTSDDIIRRPTRLDWGGKFIWANHAAKLIMRGQSIGAYKQAIHLLGSDKMLRIDPKVPDGLFTLDKASKTGELLAKARHESRIYMPEIQKKFLSHIPAAYTPLYSESKSVNDGRKKNDK